MADARTEGTPLTITNEMVAQFIMTQQALNERLQESADQMNVCLQTLLTVANDATAAGGINTPASSLNLPTTSNDRRPKHTTPHLEKFTGKDESLYPIFRGTLEAKLRTDAQAISREYEKV